MKAYLYRHEAGDWGTRGTLTIHDNSSVLILPTLELPWRDNQRNISCIPEGTYQTFIYNSRKFGRVFRVASVPGRSGILLHVGNWAGDTSKGLKSDVRGCILVGTGFTKDYGQPMLLRSRRALDRLHSFTKDVGFNITITNGGSMEDE